jgi:hypothetical protein
LALSPVGQGFLHPIPALPVASHTQAPAAGIATGPPAGTASSEAPAPVLADRNAPAPSSGRVSSVVASASQPGPAGRDSIVDGRVPTQRYTDEIINDQFYLERGGQGQDPSIVPVNETQDDGVYIVF